MSTRGPAPAARWSGSYLDALFAATEKSRICQFQRLLGLRTLLPVVLQPAELSFIYGESLKRLLWAKVALKQSQGQRIRAGAQDTRALAPKRWRGPAGLLEYVTP